jgi:gamma-glutamyl hydrolase
LFEWNTFETIDHSLGAVHSMQYLANFFVQEARQNDHSFSSAQAENQVLIYNYAPAFTGVVDTADFVQTYFF